MDTKNKEMVSVHVGRCGGTTVEKELKDYGFLFDRIHMAKAEYDPLKKYIITVRNPIDRFVSAFNYDHRWMYDRGKKKRRPKTYKEEIRTLQLYDSADDLARNIYDFYERGLFINHVSKDIYFHIGEFLRECDRENIIAVVATETLRDDMKQFFGIDVRRHERKNKEYSTFLSEEGCRNLKHYLQNDYWCIDQLYRMGLITEEKYKILCK
jgi:hypothetical protein